LSGEISINKVFIEQFMREEKLSYVDKRLIFLEDNHFELLDPVFPIGSSS